MINLPAPIHPNKQQSSAARAPHVPPSAPKDRKPLAIALVASAVLLLAAAGIATWLFIQKGGENPIINKLDPNSTQNVTSVSWVAPADLTANYVKTSQSTNTSTVVEYTDAGMGCWLTTRVMPAADSEDLGKLLTAASDSGEVKTNMVATADGATLKDADGERQYDFTGIYYSQALTSPLTPFGNQSTMAYYRQFGHSLASVGVTCKSEVFTVHRDSILETLKKFTVKTER